MGTQAGLALLLVLAGASVALWVNRGWVLPRGPGSYLRRLARVWDDFALASATAYAGADRRPELLAARTPPDRFAAEHERLQELEVEAQEGRHDLERPYHDRARAVVAALADIARLSEQLDAAAQTPEERGYAAGVAERLSVRREAYAIAGVGAERNGQAALARISRIRPPRKVAAPHAELVRAFAAQLSATSAQHAASRELDAAGVAAAARDHASSTDAVTRAWEEITARLGTRERGALPGT